MKKNISYSLFVLMIISFISVNHVCAMDDPREFDQNAVVSQILDNELYNKRGQGVRVTASGPSLHDGIVTGPSVTVTRPDGTHETYSREHPYIPTLPQQGGALLLGSGSMNSLPLTILTIILYELFNGKKLIHNLPFFSDTLKKRLALALRGGLYTNIVNNVLGSQKVWPFSKEGTIQKPLNGWKVIASYLLVDLGSRYGWDAIKKVTSKSTSDVEKKKTQKTSKFTEIIGWGAKTFLAGLITHTLP